MLLTLANVSSKPRRHWAIVTLPTTLALTLGPEACLEAPDGRRFRMVRCRVAGGRTVFRVRATLQGREIVTCSVLDVPHEVEPWLPHAWTSDNIPALLPQLGVRVQNGFETSDHWTEGFHSVDQIEKSAVHERWRVVRRIPALGVHFVWWADILHGDPVIPVWGKMVWSHRADPSPAKTFQFFAIRAGEVIAFDFAKAHGISDTIFDPATGWLRVMNREPVTLQDGAALPFSGSMLSFTNHTVSGMPGHPSDLDPDLANLYAAIEGPVVGVSHDWAGKWLANENVPQAEPSVLPSTNLTWAAFLDRIASFGGWAAVREMGSGLYPGQTGDQEDFGATKGTEAVTQFDPRWIYRALYSMQVDALRGFNHYEDNGEPLRAANHPNWWTWSFGTHWHTGVSPDRLGKVSSPIPMGTGYSGWDDQHRTHNNLAALIALTDDPLLEDQVRFMVEVDRAAYSVRALYIDAARAQGRTAGALAQLISVLGEADADALTEVMLQRLVGINSNPTLSVPGPMKVLSWGMPDGRKNVFLPSGERGRFVSLWEHGLAMVGLYAAWKLTKTPTLGNTLRKVAETMAEFGCFEHGGTWWTVGDILWSDGETPPQGLVPGSTAVAAEPGIGGVLGWTFAGMLAAREILGPTHSKAPKLNAYIASVTGGHLAGDRRQAEWWATVRSVLFS